MAAKKPAKKKAAARPKAPAAKSAAKGVKNAGARQKRAAAKGGRRKPEVLGVTSDGVRILRQKPSKRFTERELREAVAAVLRQ